MMHYKVAREIVNTEQKICPEHLAFNNRISIYNDLSVPTYRLAH